MGSLLRISFNTVKPPYPESNTPTGVFLSCILMILLILISDFCCLFSFPCCFINLKPECPLFLINSIKRRYQIPAAGSGNYLPLGVRKQAAKIVMPSHRQHHRICPGSSSRNGVMPFHSCYAGRSVHDGSFGQNGT